MNRTQQHNPSPHLSQGKDGKAFTCDSVMQYLDDKSMESLA